MNKIIFAVFTIISIIATQDSFAQKVHTTTRNKNIKSNNYIEYNKEKNSITISWSKFGSSQNYKISRGGSRLATSFELIGSTSELTFTDNNPNSNKYENYYKITSDTATIIVSFTCLEEQMQPVPFGVR